MWAHTYNPSTGETEAARGIAVRSDCATEGGRLKQTTKCLLHCPSWSAPAAQVFPAQPSKKPGLQVCHHTQLSSPHLHFESPLKERSSRVLGFAKSSGDQDSPPALRYFVIPTPPIFLLPACSSLPSDQHQILCTLYTAHLKQ